jgi:hypothetical protein
LQLLLYRYVPDCFFFRRQTVVLFSWIISMKISFGEFSLLVWSKSVPVPVKKVLWLQSNRACAKKDCTGWEGIFSMDLLVM